MSDQTPWQMFFSSQTCDFATANQYAEMENTARILTLSHWGTISLQGPDAEKFLQGQVTCDIAKLQDGKTLTGAHCSHKGRIIFSFTLFKVSSEELFLSVPQELVETALNSLKKYAVFSKVTLEDQTQHWLRFGLIHAKPRSTHHQNETTQYNAISHDWSLSELRQEIWLNTENEHHNKAVKELWEKLSATFTPVDQAHWNTQKIHEGVAWVTADHSEDFLPHQLNYQLIEAISFNKGCYTGQEIVARTQYLGKLKRALFALKIAGHYQPDAQDIFHQGKAIGKVVNWANYNNDNFVVLAILPIDAPSRENLLLKDKNDASCQLIPLPYAIPNDKED